MKCCYYELVVYYKNGTERSYKYSYLDSVIALRRCKLSKKKAQVFYCVDGVRRRVAFANFDIFSED